MIELNELNRFYLKSPKQLVDINDDEKITLYDTLDKCSKKFAVATNLDKLLSELEDEAKEIVDWCYQVVNQKQDYISDEWEQFYLGFVFEFIRNSAKGFKNDKIIHNLKTIRIFIDTLKMFIINNEEKINELELKEEN